MPNMKCIRKYTLRSTSGHVIPFEANILRFVPDVCVPEALAVNIVFCDTDEAERLQSAVERRDAPRVARFELTGYLREHAIFHTMRAICKTNDASEFTAGGQPKATAIGARLNMKVSNSEAKNLWDRYRDMQGTGEPIPMPGRLADLLAVQVITSMSDARMYAEEYGTNIDGLGLDDARRAIMADISEGAVGASATGVNTAKLSED